MPPATTTNTTTVSTINADGSRIVWGFMFENTLFTEFERRNHPIIEAAYRQRKKKHCSHHITIVDSNLPKPGKAKVYFGVAQNHLRMPGTRYYVTRQVIRPTSSPFTVPMLMPSPTSTFSSSSFSSLDSAALLQSSSHQLDSNTFNNNTLAAVLSDDLPLVDSNYNTKSINHNSSKNGRNNSNHINNIYRNNQNSNRINKNSNNHISNDSNNHISNNINNYISNHINSSSHNTSNSNINSHNYNSNNCSSNGSNTIMDPYTQLYTDYLTNDNTSTYYYYDNDNSSMNNNNHLTTTTTNTYIPEFNNMLQDPTWLMNDMFSFGQQQPTTFHHQDPVSWSINTGLSNDYGNINLTTNSNNFYNNC